MVAVLDAQAFLPLFPCSRTRRFPLPSSFLKKTPFEKGWRPNRVSPSSVLGSNLSRKHTGNAALVHSWCVILLFDPRSRPHGFTCVYVCAYVGVSVWYALPLSES